MLNLISCELSKLKRSKMVLISMAGVLSTPLLMLIQVLQTHFDKPDIAFTLADVYSDSVLYTMLLANMMVYVAIAAFLFSREYSESTLKTILPIPLSRTRLLIGKFFTLLLWIMILTFVTWLGIFIVCGLYHSVFTLSGYSLLVAIGWLPKFLIGGVLMFLTASPFAFIALKTKGFVAPMIGSTCGERCFLYYMAKRSRSKFFDFYQRVLFAPIAPFCNISPLFRVLTPSILIGKASIYFVFPLSMSLIH